MIPGSSPLARSRAVRRSLLTLGAGIAALFVAGCASGPSVWEQAFVSETGVAVQKSTPSDSKLPPVNIRSVPIERIDAVMLELDQEAAASDVPKEQWPPDKKAAAKARLLGTDEPAGPRPLLDADTLGPVARVNNLRLSNTDSVLAGVCGGLAAWSGVPAILWRVGFLVAIFAYGFGVLPYLVLWICVPRDETSAAG